MFTEVAASNASITLGGMEEPRRSRNPIPKSTRLK